MHDQPNINALWGALIIEELVRQGVDRFVIAPGSRSAPLVVAAARSGARTTVWLDERGAAFHAVGLARASGVPAAVITTSGTAVANLLPAVVESAMDGVPLVLLTADRPPELRDVGANQTIEQAGIFGDYLRWSLDLPCPDDRVPARIALTAAAESVRRALRDPGPVQLNCQFREPLAPDPAPWNRDCLQGTEAWQVSGRPFTTFARTDVPDPEGVAETATALAEARRGLLVCGAAPWSERDAVRELADALGWPWVTDVRSQLRFGNAAPAHLPHLDRLFGGQPERWEPDVVLQVGGSITSKRLRTFLDRGDAEHHVLIDPRPGRVDPGHRATRRIEGPLGSWCRALAAALPDRGNVRLDEELSGLHARIEAAMDEAIDADGGLSEPWVTRWLTQHMSAEHGLFLSSSLPIRDADDYGALNGPPLRVAANRGASGIDGVIATAAGFAAGIGGPCTLLIGDLAALHDLNALAMLAPEIPPLTIVVLNNGGGAIFSLLPIAEHPDVFTPLFDTPHAHSFEGVCHGFGLRYARVETRAAFADAYGGAAAGGHAVIEVASDMRANRQAHHRIEDAVQGALAG
ncbi:MAG: 2-succinyl-5-enolpyruvyl-6-hydroxy-3-cyclohexene-1-carboxylic-acid synthase [Gemmatimonadetes bacterium]|uniref:2-succinyl-5-enolpyruvyl-6-hydroxy-3-cyclohexene-1-carboxylate synthase n=1 Tax=Candidatus Kutchimonas denitrificans TaxID=3056748 RepID=A0AAE4Z4H1_9BACT|nr:2-succinyl-5-enolpyruvyl-6-hydroxy-3-cyclohexene-1-carboxylic-acid synthase [Gemmatimonadota bacterium]NIR73599.1 2-succinyl-5-enolpyruvyl-6-hydroxy-3-cyclohexene-1-carboxylic-acid synthase [Candidatus Kutchimonas denitrificans]NIR99558.1 2-succinyl-5-enolpyruvyl-6-hydroxy-3-cyclohexene-1-carboxylic-acid synthase [Gemmatimonadota bacterium]NIT65178.1 2-succinyl-5-enolpyruvyl-6-hydroxy-3-cyclohexene-1-carboxylic-acid synthase [Gemmatimonadota bacterium]NIV23711.1 2-succinyl-5-enolpyruvyl-6-hy